MVRLLGVDAGTTHCKAGVFDEDGSLLRLASRPTSAHRTAGGLVYHDPDELWETVVSAIREVVSGAPASRGPEGGSGGLGKRSRDHPDLARTIAVVGVASMAEAGLLVDRATGAPRTHVIPWYDRRAARQAEAVAREEKPLELFRRSGLHPSFKYGLPKLLWLREQDPGVTKGSVWLSVADYVVYRLTGRMVTDPSLAARTYVFRIEEGRWDERWIRHFDFDPQLFPEVRSSGRPAGAVTAEGAAGSAIPMGTPVAVAGHDHICTLLAAGVVEPGPVLDSVGTAESMLGVMDGRAAGKSGAVERDDGTPSLGRGLESGLTMVPHVLPGRFCWLGGLPAAGGSVEWLRTQLGSLPLSYDEMDTLLAETAGGPTGLLYFPYLSGSGAPCHDQRVRAAFIGLDASHGRGHLVKAVLEGTAYEAESIRRAAERLTERAIEELIVVGGATKNRYWAQIKADVSGCRCHVPSVPDATVLGAALTAALGSGVVSGVEEVVSIAVRCRDEGTSFVPDADRHRAYRHLYETGYLPLQRPLRQYAGRSDGAPDA